MVSYPVGVVRKSQFLFLDDRKRVFLVYTSSCKQYKSCGGGSDDDVPSLEMIPEQSYT
jgi:hypothetical protein